MSEKRLDSYGKDARGMDDTRRRRRRRRQQQSHDWPFPFFQQEQKPSSRTETGQPLNSKRFLSQVLKILFVSLKTFSLVYANVSHPYGECYRHMYAASQAGNKDLFLNTTEFVDAIRRITYGAVASLSAPLLSTFNTNQNGNGAIWISGVDKTTSLLPSPTEAAFLNQLCDDIYNGTLATLGKTLNFAECKLWITLGDRVGSSGKDDRLEKLNEFPVFCNRLAGNDLFTEDPTFSTLPTPLQLVFRDFENPNDPGMINVTGAWLTPGQNISNTQELMLQNLCRQTMVAIEAGKAMPKVPTAQPRPTLAPVNTMEFTLAECVSSLSNADTHGVVDNLLSQPEYVYFLNQLTAPNSRFDGMQFKNLPQALQLVYAEKAFAEGTNGVMIDGARYGSNKTPQNLQKLATFCDAVEAALNGQSPPSTAPVPVPVPTTWPGSEPSGTTFYIPFADCTLAMASSSSNNFLNQQEYVTFLNKVTNFNYFRDFTFAGLDQALVDNYNALASQSETENNGDGIPIDGSFPGLSRSPEQNQNLIRICLATATAMDNFLKNSNGNTNNNPPLPRPTPSPVVVVEPTTTTSRPTRVAPTPTTRDGFVTIFNGFVVANTANLQVQDLTSFETLEFNWLNQAYVDFVNSVVDGLASGSNSRRLVRSRRQLPWTGVLGATVYQIVDGECPASVTDLAAICHLVYGRFDATYVNEATNESALALSLQQYTQNSILKATGGLDSFLDDQSNLTVVGLPADGQVKPGGGTPTRAPAGEFGTKDADRGDDNDDDKLTSNTKFLLSVAVVGLVLCCCCLAAYLFYCHDGFPSRGRQRPDEVSHDELHDDFDKNGNLDRAQPEEAPNPLAPRSAKSRFGLGRRCVLGSVHHTKMEETEEFSVQDTATATKPTDAKSLHSRWSERSSSAPFLWLSKKRNSVDNISSTSHSQEGIADPTKVAKRSNLNASDWNPQKMPSHLSKGRHGVTNVGSMWASSKNEDDYAAVDSGPDDTDRTPSDGDGGRPGDGPAELFDDEAFLQDDGAGEEELYEEVSYEDFKGIETNFQRKEQAKGEEVFQDEGEDNEDYFEEVIEEVCSSDESSESETHKGDEAHDDSTATSRREADLASVALTSNVQQFDNMVESGDWDGVVQSTLSAAQKYKGTNDDADSYVQRRGSMELSTVMQDEDDDDDDDDESTEEEVEEEFSNHDSGDSTLDTMSKVAASMAEQSHGDHSRSSMENRSKSSLKSAMAERSVPSATSSGYKKGMDSTSNLSSMSFTSDELRNREAYRERIEELVRKVVPGEADNVENMMRQFSGREEELIKTLQNMYNRSSTVRARQEMQKAIPVVLEEKSESSRLFSNGATNPIPSSERSIDLDELETDLADDIELSTSFVHNEGPTSAAKESEWVEVSVREPHKLGESGESYEEVSVPEPHVLGESAGSYEEVECESGDNSVEKEPVKSGVGGPLDMDEESSSSYDIYDASEKPLEHVNDNQGGFVTGNNGADSDEEYDNGDLSTKAGTKHNDSRAGSSIMSGSKGDETESHCVLAPSEAEEIISESFGDNDDEEEEASSSEEEEEDFTGGQGNLRYRGMDNNYSEGQGLMDDHDDCGVGPSDGYGYDGKDKAVEEEEEVVEDNDHNEIVPLNRALQPKTRHRFSGASNGNTTEDEVSYEDEEHIGDESGYSNSEDD